MKKSKDFIIKKEGTHKRNKSSGGVEELNSINNEKNINTQ